MIIKKLKLWCRYYFILYFPIPFVIALRLNHFLYNGRSEISKGYSLDVLPLPSATDKIDSAVALVKSGSEKVKITPAGEYLTAALMGFDPEQYDSLVAIADGANKLLMLVSL